MDVAKLLSPPQPKLLSPPQPADQKRLQRTRRIQTKAGCIVCKARKVKCGEQKPSCANCIKHRVQCTYKNSTAFERVTKDKGIQSDFPDVPEPLEIKREYVGPTIASTSACLPFSLLDMELLHHWNHYTYTCSSADIGVNALMRRCPPELGFEYPFLLRAVLALSALHMATLQAAKKEYYATYAAKLHRLAIEEEPSLSTITAENCAAFQLFGAMNCFYSFSPARLDHDSDDTGDSLPSKQFTVLHKLRAVMYAALGTLYTSVVSPFIHHGDKRHVMLIAAVDARTQCKAFDGLWWMISEEEKDPVKLGAYSDTISIFQATWVVVNNSLPGELESADLLLGLYNVPVEYIALLKENDQAALVIFAYAGVALKALECYWWLQGRSVHLVSEIWELLDEKHRAWMEWPLQETGWTPPAYCSTTILTARSTACSIATSSTSADVSPFPDILEC